MRYSLIEKVWDSETSKTKAQQICLSLYVKDKAFNIDH